MKKYLFLVWMAVAFVSCGKQHGQEEQADTIALEKCPQFQQDSAMQYVKDQCAFGPRVTGTNAHVKCGDWIVEKFKSFGCEVTEQKCELTAYDGTKLPGRNIIASFNPSSPDRVLICAHWDSRPWADNDPDQSKWHTPVMAASDGASGVAVMLEMARALQSMKLDYGVDFVCFDAEDLGIPDWDKEKYDAQQDEASWCLGSTYWAQHPHKEGYAARYGILFDMVGSRGAKFAMEGYSMSYAQTVVDYLWHLADQIGYGTFFPIPSNGQAQVTVTDDHVPVNQIARIPCIDVIANYENGSSSFGPTWHTTSDTPENIDPAVMKAVGQSVLQMLYNDNSK